MRLNKQTIIQVLEIAAEKGEAGFEEKDIIPLFDNNEYDLVFHLDYLTDKGFIIGEFTSGAWCLCDLCHYAQTNSFCSGRNYRTRSRIFSRIERTRNSNSRIRRH